MITGEASLGTNIVIARIEDSPKRLVRTDWAAAWQDYRNRVAAEYSFNYVPNRHLFAVMVGPEATPFVHYSIELDPEQFPYHYNLANALTSLGQLKKARRHVEQAIGLNPDYLPALNNLGKILYEQGDASQALELFKRVVALKPDLPVGHNNLVVGERKAAVGAIGHQVAVAVASIRVDCGQRSHRV